MKSLISLFLILISLLSSISYAGDVVPLNSGDKAPFTGYLISQETANSIRINKIDLDSTKKILSLTQDENKLLELRITNANGEVDRLSKQLVTERSGDILSKVGFFVLGAVITGFVAYGTTRIIK